MSRILTTNVLELDHRDIVDESLVNVKLTDKDEIAAEQYVFHLHPTSYGRTYFLVYNGKLRQFKMIRTYLCPWNWHLTHNHKNVRAIHELEICGLGRLFVAHNDGSGTNFVCKVYKSPEDYKEGKEAYLGYNADNLLETQPFGFSLVYNRNFFSEHHYVAKVWRWNGTRAVEENVRNVYMFYWFDEDGLGTQDTNTLPKGYYRTKEECEKDNSIEVEYFAELVKPEEPKTTTELFFGTKYTLTEDEVKKVKDLISSFNKA